MKHLSLLSKVCVLLAAGAAFAALPLATRAAAEGGTGMANDHAKMSDESMPGMAMKSGSPMTVTGEVLDMACYLDHGAQGEKHAECAQTCISSGLPVGIKSADGTVYLLIGEHKPANSELADYAAKTITVKGKYVTRDGIKMLENIEIVK